MNGGAGYQCNIFSARNYDNKVTGTESQIESLGSLDQTEMVAKFGDASAISASSNYSFLLPNLNVNLEINDDLVARFCRVSYIAFGISGSF